MASRFAPGQRWLSQTEPELGLGLVIKSEPDKVTIVFPSSETTRVYTIEAPPLTRVIFSPGDILKTQEGKSFVVEEVTEKEGLVIYVSKGKKIDESRLSDSLTFSKPIDRLLNAQVDDKGIYNLRHRALYRRFKTYRAPLRGLLGGRFHPAAHQLYVATQATRAAFPRVLLADEPGLGRRIEAGLILQRLQLAGSASKVLLLVPEAEIDWCEVEFSRRFGFSFTRLSAEELIPPTKPVAKKAAKSAKAKVAEPAAPAFNPFVSEGPMWFSCPLELFKSKPGHFAAQAGLDILVVDGAEQVPYTEANPGSIYNAIEEASGGVRSLILLSSAGPETDPEGHYGRVRLLDPEDFPTTRKYNKHRKENEELEIGLLAAAKAADIDRETEALLKPLAANDTKVKDFIKSWKEDKESARDQLIEHVLDTQECGRRVFHNTHRSIIKLPAHEVDWIRLEPKPEVRDELREEFKTAGKAEPSTPKTKASASAMDSSAATWLTGIIAPPILPAALPLAKGVESPPPPPPSPKALVICSNRARAMAVAKALTKKLPEKIVLVNHEAHSVTADFAAIVVGLEDTCGRAFAGVDFLVFWDAPHTATEARIGASLLDYTSNSSVKIMIPYVEDTPQEILGRWLQEGVHAFAGYSPAQSAVVEEHGKTAHDLAKRIGARHNPKISEELKALIKKSAATFESALKKIEKHRDEFLENASCRPTYSEQALHRMHSSDEDLSLDLFTNRVLEHTGITVEQQPGRICQVKWNLEALQHLEAIPKEGFGLTYSRKTAIAQEALQHLTWDSDLIAKATERLLSTAVGNTAYVVWEDERAQLVLLEGIYLAEPPPADPLLHVWRFMPPTPVRVVVSHELEDLSGTYTTELVNKNVRNGRKDWLRNNARPLHNLVPGMLRNLNQRAEIKAQELAAKAAHQMGLILTAEKTRLETMTATTQRTGEIDRITAQIAALQTHLAAPRMRLDSLRLIRRGPSGKGI
jgi:ATP-dependent helicase HepA